MQVTLANPRGFCAGVNMAIECLDEAIRIFGSGIYVYHEIVHNRHVVERFTAQGVTFVDRIEDVPPSSISCSLPTVCHRKFDNWLNNCNCRRSTPPAPW